MSSNDSQIRVNMVRSQTESPTAAKATTPLSIYMYAVGLIMSLAGIYAVTYDMADTNFATILRVLVVCGYAVSYWLRRNNVDLTQYQAPLLVVFATVMYFVASTAPSQPSPSALSGANRPYDVQVIVIWIAVLQSFTLVTDSAILFACVPSMALIGIMSSGTPDDEVQNAFIVFLASATFLMVHENHLRTRATLAIKGKSRTDNRFFTGELVLVGCCVAGTMLLAGVVARPIQVIGKALIPTNPQDSFNRGQSRQNPANANIRVDELPGIELAVGPATETNTPLLEITCSQQPQYWRGKTYDYYSGTRFEDHLNTGISVAADDPTKSGSQSQNQTIMPQSQDRPNSTYRNYTFTAATWDIGSGAMNGSTENAQTVKVLGGTIYYLYGAPAFGQVTCAFPTVLKSDSGGLQLITPLLQGQMYSLVSFMPNSDPDTLRNATGTFPAAVTSHYLQIANANTAQISSLRDFADTCVQGKANEYDRVMALRDAIAARCTYNLQAAAIPRGRDVVQAFLFDTKEGYCDSFAAALTVLCRYEHIPARLASGFLPGDQQKERDYIVREKHRHAWTEVYFTDIGWVPFDATEGAVDTSPKPSADSKGAMSPIRWLTTHGPGPPVIFLLIVVMLAYVIKRELLGRRSAAKAVSGYALLPAGNMEIVQIYLKACRLLAQAGYPRISNATPIEFARSVRERIAATAGIDAPLRELTGLHERFCYGPSAAGAQDVESARALLTSIRELLRKLPRTARPISPTVPDTPWR